MSDTNRTRQLLKEQGLCVGCSDPLLKDKRNKKKVSALYCTKCGKWEPDWRRMRSACCGAPLHREDCCPTCKAANAKDQTAMRKERAAARRCPHCDTEECYSAWDLMVAGLLPDKLNKVRRGCVRTYLSRHSAAQQLLEKHGWPGVLEHISHKHLAVWFGPVRSKIKRAADFIEKNPDSAAARGLRFENAISDPEYWRAMYEATNKVLVAMGEQPKKWETQPFRETQAARERAADYLAKNPNSAFALAYLQEMVTIQKRWRLISETVKKEKK